MGAEVSPNSDSRVADAAPSNWVDRWAPLSWRPYLRLGRFDRPIGAWLLLFPCWWSQTLAQVASREPFPNFRYLLLFAIGAFAMRASGCAYNDYVDRYIDAQVQRTASRPIPSGQVTPGGALKFVALTALVGLAVLLQFDWFTVWLGIASLLIVAVYPFAKRVTSYPQFVLGLAFNWGALVGWAAEKGSLDWPAVALYAGCVFWTVGYDTIYAHQDKEDDALLGLGSTALHFGENTVSFVGAFYGLAGILWLTAGALAGAHLVFFLSVTLVFLQMSWQVATLDINDPANCLRRFKSNREVGIAVLLGLIADMALSWFAGLS
ncbi:4-hydroxybenzoate polyprenyl transferase [Hyphomicrobium denitrificans 1NES1]|uniref:4-hydroxybenzoate octaprenyltransferase n=1 Tax=Hyphomicrobium denitrificans 1NES1 TaxID=670307 RepID=N0B5Z5_9HYPH|nr:4-hydroxybenzoate octaprenyltransferase [Hyphomicrobium denitrificans]AGK58974.1 4-hydroxybenzoate polyprenyl transferase [Hyphomicrobium denitrificans 1NES1]